MVAAGHLAPRCYDNWVRLKRRLSASRLSLRCKVVSVAHAINCKKRPGRAIRRLWDAAAGGQERRAASAATVVSWEAAAASTGERALFICCHIREGADALKSVNRQDVEFKGSLAESGGGRERENQEVGSR